MWSNMRNSTENLQSYKCFCLQPVCRCTVGERLWENPPLCQSMHVRQGLTLVALLLTLLGHALQCTSVLHILCLLVHWWCLFLSKKWDLALCWWWMSSLRLLLSKQATLPSALGVQESALWQSLRGGWEQGGEIFHLWYFERSRDRGGAVQLYHNPNSAIEFTYI